MHRERDDLVVVHGLAVLRHLQCRGDEAGGFELLEVDLEQRPADAQVACQLAHVIATTRERGDDPHAVRVGKGRQQHHQIIAGRRVIVHSNLLQINVSRCFLKFA